MTTEHTRDFIINMTNAVSDRRPVPEPTEASAHLYALAREAERDERPTRAALLYHLSGEVASLPDARLTPAHNCADHVDASDFPPVCAVCGCWCD